MRKDTPMTIDILLKDHPALTTCRSDVEAARDLIIHTYVHGGRLLLCGNGGSCADCDHITGELLKGFLSRRRLTEDERQALAVANPDDPDAVRLANKLQGGLPALSLPSQTALVSAFCNTCRFLKDISSVLTLFRDNFSYSSLSDDRVPLTSDASIHK